VISPGQLIEHRPQSSSPYFSICVPQYNRTSYLLKAIESYTTQTFRDFEVCISDDLSPDGRQSEVIAALEKAGIPFAVQVQATNQRYDGNLRAAIALARGKYCLLMGNDDALAGPDTLAAYVRDLEDHGPAGVVIPNYADFTDRQKVLRVPVTRNLGSGPSVAAERFRNFGFVSGILLDRETSQHYTTERWDGSEYYQMYIGCCIIAAGGHLLELDRVTVWKDIPVLGEEVDSYAKRPKVWPCPIVERPLPLNQFGRLVAAAIAPHVSGEERRRLNETIFRQLYSYTYSYWLTQYRRVQSWRFAAGVALGMRPERSMAGVDLVGTRRWRTVWTYRLATVAGLSVPITLFDQLRAALYRWAKR
jgi:glycosyltransferase involved in cell wall biosynthesis